MKRLVRTAIVLAMTTGSHAMLAQQTPATPDSLFDRGLTAYRRADLGRAFLLFQRAHDADPSNIEAQLYYAETARRLDSFDITPEQDHATQVKRQHSGD